MATLAIASIGALGASAVGLSANAGWVVGSLLGNRFLGGKTPTRQLGPRLNDLSVQTSTYGKSIPIVYGSHRVQGNLIWSMPIAESSHTVTQNSKMSRARGKYYTYAGNFALGLCEGPMDKLLKIWANGKLIYDAASMNQGALHSYACQFRFYNGDENQQPDYMIEAECGVGKTPAFRGLSYIVFEDLPLADFGNRIPVIECEITQKAKPVYPKKKVLISKLQHDNHVLSQHSPFLYHEFSGILSKVDRMSGRVVLEKNIKDDREFADFSVKTVGKIYLDDIHNELYVCLSVKERSFIAVFEAGSLELKRHNMADCKAPKSIYADIICNDDYVFVVDSLGHEICGFLKESLQPLHWTIKSPEGRKSFGELGQFTLDEKGNPALLTHPKNGKYFYLTQFNDLGGYEHHCITGYGKRGAIAYDQATQCYLLGCGKSLLKLDKETLKVRGELEGCTTGTYSHSAFLNQTACYGTIWTYSGSKIYKINTRIMQVEEEYDAHKLWKRSPKGFVYDPWCHAVWGTDRGLYCLSLDRVETQQVLLGDVLQDIVTRACMRNRQDQFRLGNRSVHGVAISQQMTAREIIEMLAAAFDFSCTESEEGLVFKYFVDAVPVAIEESACAVSHSDKDFSYGDLSEVITQDIEIPKKINVIYSDVQRAYETSIQASARFHDLSTVQQCNLGFPIAMSADEAKQLSERQLAQAWLHRHTYTLYLPPKYLALDVGDVIEISGVRGALIRITAMDTGANSLIKVQGVAECLENYHSTAKGSVVPVIEEVLDLPGPTQAYFLNLPALTEDKEDTGFYLACGGLSAGWHGAAIYKISQGAEEHLLTIPASGEAAHGKLMSDLPVGPIHCWDRTTEIKVEFFNAANVPSLDEEAVLNGENALLIGDEIIHSFRPLFAKAATSGA